MPRCFCCNHEEPQASAPPHRGCSCPTPHGRSGIATSLGLKYNLGKNKKNLQWYNPLSETYHSQARTRKQIQGLRKDTDNDGVADQFDADPNTPDNISVDGSGKPLDVDMDGVFDYLDADPFSSKEAVVDENGLEVDSDGDGQISFPEFWHAVENDVPQGMLVLRQTFMARVQNATMSANIARNFNFQHTTAWTPPASYVGDVIMGGGSQFCNM